MNAVNQTLRSIEAGACVPFLACQKHFELSGLDSAFGIELHQYKTRVNHLSSQLFMGDGDYFIYPVHHNEWHVQWVGVSVQQFYEQTGILLSLFNQPSDLAETDERFDPIKQLLMSYVSDQCLQVGVKLSGELTNLESTPGSYLYSVCVTNRDSAQKVFLLGDNSARLLAHFRQADPFVSSQRQGWLNQLKIRYRVEISSFPVGDAVLAELRPGAMVRLPFFIQENNHNIFAAAVAALPEFPSLKLKLTMNTSDHSSSFELVEQTGDCLSALETNKSISLQIHVGELVVSLAELSELRPEQVLKLNSESWPGVSLVYQGKTVASGELVLWGDEISVQINSVINHE